MVFWNKTRFSSYDEAVKSDNGMCVLTTLIEVGVSFHQFDRLPAQVATTVALLVAVPYALLLILRIPKGCRHE